VVNNVQEIKNHFIILVRYSNKFERVEDSFPEVFIIPSRDLMGMRQRFGEQYRITNLKNIMPFKDKWSLLK
jgi:hypothetical protein